MCGNALKISEYVINPRSLPFLIIVSTRSSLNSFFKSAFVTCLPAGRLLAEIGCFDFFAIFLYFRHLRRKSLELRDQLVGSKPFILRFADAMRQICELLPQ